jgi:hypothetical protein
MTTITNLENIKIQEIMETKINFDKEFSLSIINNKAFVLWLKEQIKSLVADQKIAKRDRKDARHPCPEKRKYGTYEAWMRANSNGLTLRIYYAIYYILRHRRGFEWEKITMKKSGSGWSWSCGWGLPDGLLEAVRNIDKTFDGDLAYPVRRELGNLVEKFCTEKVNEWNTEKALCHN